MTVKLHPTNPVPCPKCEGLGQLEQLDVDLFKKCDRCVDGEVEMCPECRGDGGVTEYSDEDPGVSEYVKCESCDGTGAEGGENG